MMSPAVESIVSVYVRLKNREALQALLAHRSKLLEDLNRVSGIDPKLIAEQFVEDIEAIKAGLERLDGKTDSECQPDSRPVVGSAVETPKTDPLPAVPRAQDESNEPVRVMSLAVSVSSPNATEGPESSQPDETIAQEDFSHRLPKLDNKTAADVQSRYSIDAFKSLVSVWFDDGKSS